MNYSAELEIPANTSTTSPSFIDLKLTTGILNRFEIEFPSGCVGLVGVSVTYGGSSLFPSTKLQWFRSDNYVMKFDEYWQVPTAPNTIRILGYNDDDTYSHTIQFRCSVLEPWQVSLHNDFTYLSSLIKAFLGKLGIA